jgi:hypothetical protein
MVKALEQERKARKLESVPETVTAVLGGVGCQSWDKNVAKSRPLRFELRSV